MKTWSSDTRQRILECMREQDWSIKALADELGLNRNTVGDHLRRMEKAGLVHIPRWYRQVGNKGGLGAIYRLGSGVSVPCPKNTKKHKRISNRRYRENNKMKIRIKRSVTLQQNGLGIYLQLLQKS